jgi:hypothetical protein
LADSNLAQTIFAVEQSRKRLILLVGNGEERAKTAVVPTKDVFLVGDL